MQVHVHMQTHTQCFLLLMAFGNEGDACEYIEVDLVTRCFCLASQEFETCGKKQGFLKRRIWFSFSHFLAIKGRTTLILPLAAIA